MSYDPGMNLTALIDQAEAGSSAELEKLMITYRVMADRHGEDQAIANLTWLCSSKPPATTGMLLAFAVRKLAAP